MNDFNAEGAEQTIAKRYIAKGRAEGKAEGLKTSREIVV